MKIYCYNYDIDNSTMKRRQLYDRFQITDSTGCGFELLYYTTNQVTDERYREIKSRKHLHDSYKTLRENAANHFRHDLINTDIYDFVKYAKRFDIDSLDVRLVNIWVYGKRYEKLYQQPHPDFPSSNSENCENSDLGVLYLKENDVYPYNFLCSRTYRYWGCSVTSSKDERYTHILK